MNARFASIGLISLAVIALAVALCVRSVKRAETARFVAERRASEEEIAVREARKAEAEANEAASAARAAEAKAVASSNDLARVRAERELAALESATEKAASEKAASEKATAQANARAAAEATAKAKAEAAAKASDAAKAAAEEAKAKLLAESEAEKRAAEEAKRDASVAEAKVLELRKIDFETWQTRLVELDQDLTERERALKPDLSIYDSSNITWVAEREPDEIGATGSVRRVKAAPVSPENDLTLPRPTRLLARTNRLTGEDLNVCVNSSSNAVVAALERLYRRACDDGRVIDADFYLKSIRFYYPHWAPAPVEKRKETHHGE